MGHSLWQNNPCSEQMNCQFLFFPESPKIFWHHLDLQWVEALFIYGKTQGIKLIDFLAHVQIIKLLRLVEIFQ